MLEYYVYKEDVNNRNIKKYNIFQNARFFDGVLKAYEKYKKDHFLDSFKEEVKHQLMGAFWSKCEYEIILTSWPPHMAVEQVDKLKSTIEEHTSKWSWKQIRVNAPLEIAEKIDIYDQVMLNFNIFFDYLLKNADELKGSSK